MVMLEGITKIIKRRNPKQNTWIVVIPAKMVTDSAFPLKDANEVDVSIKDHKVVITKASWGR